MLKANIFFVLFAAAACLMYVRCGQVGGVSSGMMFRILFRDIYEYIGYSENPGVGAPLVHTEAACPGGEPRTSVSRAKHRIGNEHCIPTVAV